MMATRSGSDPYEEILRRLDKIEKLLAYREARPPKVVLDGRLIRDSLLRLKRQRGGGLGLS